MSTQTLPPASYTGQSGGLKKSTIWLASEDIGLDVEKNVTIEDVELHRNVKFDQGRTEEKVPALKFATMDKRMILNSTNRKMLVRLFGMDTKDWRGKRVALYVDPDVKMAGQKVNGLRIRPAQPEQEIEQPPQSEPAQPDPIVEALIATGNEKAKEGVEHLKQWWSQLSRPHQHALKANLPAWKATSENAETGAV